jgi:hypothetical protein
MFQTEESRLIDVKLSKIASHRSGIASLSAAPVFGHHRCHGQIPKIAIMPGTLKPPAGVNHSFRWHPESR